MAEEINQIELFNNYKDAQLDHWYRCRVWFTRKFVIVKFEVKNKKKFKDILKRNGYKLLNKPFEGVNYVVADTKEQLKIFRELNSKGVIKILRVQKVVGSPYRYYCPPPF